MNKRLDALELINKIEQKGSIYDLDCMKELLRRLHEPQRSLNVIHVAGTNGKGSVIAFLAEILGRAGYLVGKFTSPAVFSKTECFCVDRQSIGEQKYRDLLEEILELASQMKQDGFREPTAFELETALAFLFFKRSACQFVLLETGLGGDSDATNVIERPLVSVFTPISLDHTQLLGHSLKEIAMHKSGIIKNNCPVVSSHQSEEVKEILERQAARMNASIAYAKSYQTMDSDSNQKFIYNKRCQYEISMLGKHQIENACVALAVTEQLGRLGYPIEEQAVRQGLYHASWHGRLTRLYHKPDIYMDGAHNEGAANALAAAIDQYMEGKRIIMIAGMFADKDYQRVIAIAAAKAEQLITITPPVRRALSAEQLKQTAEFYGIKAKTAATVNEAVETALKQLDRKDALLAFGSLSFLREFEQSVKSFLRIGEQRCSALNR